MDAVNHQFFTNILYNSSVQNNNRARRDPRIVQFIEFFYVSRINISPKKLKTFHVNNDFKNFLIISAAYWF